MTGDYSAADLCRILRLDASQLRACLRAALLPPPGVGRSCTYSFQNLVVLRTAKGLTDAGVSVAKIRKVLECLERQLEEDTSIASVKIYASGKRVVVWDGASRWRRCSRPGRYGQHLKSRGRNERRPNDGFSEP
jgi:DNA-binding transcriptional MerR regulator